MNSSLLDFHNKLIDKNGIDRASGFSPEGQRRRFDVILQSLRIDTGDSLLDYGCGTGDLLEYLVCRNRCPDYTGMDINPAFIARLQQRFNPRIVCGSILDASIPVPLFKFDHVVASGVFCYADQVPDHEQILKRLWSVTRDNLVVNFLKRWEGKSKNPVHCFYDLDEILAMARRLTAPDPPHLRLLTDYAENDITLVLRRHIRP